GFALLAQRPETRDGTFRGRTDSPTPQNGINPGKDLAHDPATARHIARKLAVHFIADEPPPESIARLEKTFTETKGDLHALARTAVEDVNAWTPGRGKLRTPVEYVTAGYRLLDLPKGETSEKQV